MSCFGSLVSCFGSLDEVVAGVNFRERVLCGGEVMMGMVLSNCR